MSIISRRSLFTYHRDWTENGFAGFLILHIHWMRMLPLIFHSKTTYFYLRVPVHRFPDNIHPPLVLVRWLRCLCARVAWIVLVLSGVHHGTLEGVDSVHDDEACSVEWSHWAGDRSRELLR